MYGLPAKILLAALLVQAAALAQAAQPSQIAEREQGSPAVETRTCPAMEKAARQAPEQIPDLQEYIDAHFESLHQADGLFPAQALIRFKTPVSPVS